MNDLTVGGVRPLLADVLDVEELAVELAADKVTRRTHPALPLSIYSYSRDCQYENHWTPVTTRTRGLVVDDETGRVAAFCLPKFFNAGQHGKADFAPALPDEPFEVYDKVDGSLGIVFFYRGAWRTASKGSFTSEQAVWAQRFVDRADTSGLDPSVTYIAEIIYPENRIVVNYGDRQDLVLLAAFRSDGTEQPLREAAAAWGGVGSVVRTYDWSEGFGALAAMAETNQLLDGGAATGTDAEGWVIRFASGLRVKTKLSGYVSLHYRLTSIGPRDIWRALAVQLHPAATDVQIAQALGVPKNEVAGMRRIPGGPMAPLLADVPDEYDAWVRGIADDLTARAASLTADIEQAHATLAHLTGDRAAYARAAKDCDGFVRAGMFLLLDGRPVAMHVWRMLKPVAANPFRSDEEETEPAAVEARKPTVHLMRGLPASGKSTRARELMAGAAGAMRRVSLDDLRRMLDANDGSQRLGRRHEETVLAVQDAAVLAAVADGFDVVVDNTHLIARIPNRLKRLVEGRAVFEVHDFTDVDMEECIRRDALRENPVGEEHIRAMALRLASVRASGWTLTAEALNTTAPVEPYVPDPALPAAVLCDIDGTLADNKHRGPYDWAKVETDVLIEATADALVAFAARGDRIVLMSGRGEEVREATERWLAANAVRYDELWMRKAGDQRGDDVVKGELFDAQVRHRFRVRLVLDDRERVVALWRKLGLTCWQVDYGDF